jgi:hypothetical protein
MARYRQRMRKLALAFPLIWFAGCSMYGAPPAHLHPVEPIHHVVTPDGPAPVVYNDDCTVDFHRKPPPQGVQRQPAVAATHVVNGNATLATANKTSSTTTRVDLLRSAIQHYSDALRADPFDATATLELAVAYDQALHRGCALALLHRIDELAQNPKFATDANHRADDVVINRQWFRGYRKDALAAVNR